MLDPLANETLCKRDVAEFVKLGVNTIRVYMTDNSANHDVCMNALADAGIYVIIDANNPLYSINRDDPKPSYNSAYLQSVFSTLDEFAKFGNTMAFFSGNEVVNDLTSSTLAAPYVKATTRDMRKYLAIRGHRKVPVGYSAADGASNRIQMAHYMNCGSDEERSDFFAFVSYFVPLCRNITKLTLSRTITLGATLISSNPAGLTRSKNSLATGFLFCKS